jgi:DNA-binding response OmpR family regulator
MSGFSVADAHAAPPALPYRVLMPFRVLVADDEPHIREVVRAYLEREGYEVLEAADGNTALDLARTAAPELLVLDVMLPERSGFDILRALRGEGSTVGVVMLTARDDVIDRVAGLELGADDYITKPFEPREVVARVGAVLRRVARPAAVAAGASGGPGGAAVGAAAGSLLGAGGIVAPPAGETTQLFDLEIDLAAREVRRGDQDVSLTRTELDLLAALAEQPGLVWTREQIGGRVFGESFDVFDRTVDSHVKNLRAKLGMRPDGGAYVETIRGVGYRAARPGRDAGPEPTA